MKKLVLTIAIVLGLSAVSFADVQKEGGLFKRGDMPKSEGSELYSNNRTNPLLPSAFNTGDDAEASTTPLGSGIALLLGLGGAYLVAKRRKED